MNVQKTEKGEELQLVSFKLAEEEYGVSILSVQEIIRMPAITKVPQAPDFVEGIINLRGLVIPIVDLRKRFGLDIQELDKDSRIIVVELDGSTVGMIVDSVSEVLRINTENIEPPPPIVAGISAEYLHGVGKLGERLLILLDLNKILSSKEVAGIKKTADLQPAEV